MSANRLLKTAFEEESRILDGIAAVRKNLLLKLAAQHAQGAGPLPQTGSAIPGVPGMKSRFGAIQEMAGNGGGMTQEQQARMEMKKLKEEVAAEVKASKDRVDHLKAQIDLMKSQAKEHGMKIKLDEALSIGDLEKQKAEVSSTAKMEAAQRKLEMEKQKLDQMRMEAEQISSQVPPQAGEGYGGVEDAGAGLDAVAGKLGMQGAGQSQQSAPGQQMAGL